eukprot:NODE_1542_length_859_cov_262.391358_g1196_i0.p1 GENE.NODE_1542_length_859_cov_262.391358_g1196_i0~~NODE_1542_length_859_cov_262.391358_g1196_i0.p1  ORF type:complete len:270 (+),score=73.96 NODE_1542_length_859_cov_262.391358_g1196_i0:68-811(+)
MAMMLPPSDPPPPRHKLGVGFSDGPPTVHQSVNMEEAQQLFNIVVKSHREMGSKLVALYSCILDLPFEAQLSTVSTLLQTMVAGPGTSAPPPPSPLSLRLRTTTTTSLSSSPSSSFISSIHDDAISLFRAPASVLTADPTGCWAKMGEGVLQIACAPGRVCEHVVLLPSDANTPSPISNPNPIHLHTLSPHSRNHLMFHDGAVCLWVWCEELLQTVRPAYVLKVRFREAEAAARFAHSWAACVDRLP